MMSSDHHHWMRRAARLAFRGHGGSEPNPMVGCLIVSDGQVVGSGYHRRFGGPHAEVEAITSAGEKSRGGVMYVTLEPCNHTGQTGPCSQAIIDAGIDSVVIGQQDPNPIASGGMETLIDAGIDTTVLHDEASAAVLRPFLHTLTTGLPWVIAKWAQTHEGSLTTPPGESPWISNAASQRRVHRQRGRVDAILTGIGTVLADDPLLTPRCRAPRRIPIRVVIDSTLQTPMDSQLVATARSTPVVIYCRKDADRMSVRALERAGATVTPLPPSSGHVDLDGVLADLARTHQVTTVLLEAGPRLLNAMFAGGLVSETLVFTAPPDRHSSHQTPPFPRGEAPVPADDATLVTVDERCRDGDTITRAVVVSSPSSTPR